MDNFHRHLRGRKGLNKVTDGVYTGVWEKGRAGVSSTCSHLGRVGDSLSQDPGCARWPGDKGTVDIVCSGWGMGFRGEPVARVV